MTETISVRIPKELADRLSNLSKQTGRTKTYYIQETLEDKVCETL
ncbi:MAG: ribbon-helix-helix domain-containing protein [Sphaerochaeta sp.]|nr:ribbon-helix-helix domain-containing protein [Sphaerochaeta sp.]